MSGGSGGGSAGHGGSSAGMNGGAAGAGSGGAGGGGLAGGVAGTNGGASGASGAGGAGATAGAGGSAPTQVSCTFQISGSLSPQIPTVGLVDWSTDLGGLTAARVEFSLDDPAAGEINVGSGGPISPTEPRALLLGLKPGRSYTYRIVATAGDRFCTSEDHKIQTQTDPAVPALTRVAGDGYLDRANGFVLSCISTDALIIDSDGVAVWRTKIAAGCNRALMDWDGAYLWTELANPGGDSGGSVSRVRMDGSDLQTIAGLERTHHDFAVLPGGIVAFLSWKKNDTTLASEVIERSPDGTLRTVASLDDTTLSGDSAGTLHANGLRYYQRDDSYSVSDLFLAGVYKFNRQGELAWQVRPSCFTFLSGCYSVPLAGIHGHELLDNGDLLFFSANAGGLGGRANGAPSPVYEYSLAQPDGSPETLEWTYLGELGSDELGDVQRLPNGNTLVTYSIFNPPHINQAQGTIREVSATGTVVRSVTGGAMGYSSFRETLYGPPR
ncbi:MAG TPA: hypothetical protein VMT03_06335 [Polyangia bacterium]|nr:hypothetical protein [Polyangia bacterium]